jgi:chromosome segregation ATPase
MAEVKKVKIEGDTSGAVKAMDNLSQATKEVAQEFNNAATFAERYGEELQPLTARMGEAEDRLYELANAGETASKEYQDLLETVSRYRKVQIQTDMAVDAAATTMAQKL